MSGIEEKAPGLTLEQKRSLVAKLLREEAGRRGPSTAFAHRLFEERAIQTPDATAVSDHGTSLSYGELGARSDRLAGRLRAQGVGPEVLVGLCVRRSPEAIVALLAVLKAGGAYVPIDPALPSARIAYMLADADVTVLITELELRERLPAGEARVICVDSDWGDEIAKSPAAVDLSPGNLAYVIYTSGSTGRPKGVQVTHGALANLLQSMKKLTAMDASDALLAVTTLSFDIAALEIFLPLAVGARIELVEREVAADGSRLLERLADPAVKFLQATPATWRMLLDAGWAGRPDLTMLCGGEALPRTLADRLLGKGRALWNVYGPTETTIWSTAGRVGPGEGPVPIGRPIANTRLYVLDQGGRPSPVGVAGELYIGGAGLARGYLRRPGLTAERFPPDPFGPPGGRLYRTGDLARWRADGSLECLGRVDHQVKVRGFRIELGEIETALAAHPEVREAVVAAREDSAGETSLAAYVVAPGDAGLISAAELRRWLLATLPEYMIPSAFVAMDALPLTPNGKIDRDALPDPRQVQPGSGWSTPPRGPVEEAIAGAWAATLGIERIGAHDNFFELGGHSLMAIQLVARMKHTFGVEPSLKDFVETPTVARLARLVEDALAGASAPAPPPITPVDRSGPLPASFAQQRLWFLDQLEPGQPTYNIPTAVRLVGDLDVAALEAAIAEIVRRHEALRTTFRADGGIPFQVIAGPRAVPLSIVDLTHFDPESREPEAFRLIDEEAARPFDLAAGPLLRAYLIKLGEAEHVVLLTMHHIIADGWSIGVLVREVSALFEAFRQGEPSPLPEPSLQYADFAAWQRDWFRGDVLRAQLDYWSGKLEGLPALEIPTDRPKPAVPSPRGGERHLLVPKATLEGARELGRGEGATLYMTLLAAFQVLLGRHSGQDDFAVGSPIAGRTRAELEGLIGSFANTLVLRADLAGNPGFRALLGRTREAALGAYTHQEMPFYHLLGLLRTDREANRSPLFRVMFALQNAPLPALEARGLRFEPLGSIGGAAKFDLTLSAVERPDGLHLKMEYRADLFDPPTVDRLLAHFRTLLEAAVAEPDRPIGSLTMLTEEERRRMLVGWNESGEGALDEWGDDDLGSLPGEFEAEEIAGDE